MGTATITVPLRDTDGVLRIGQTRVTLDSVIYAFRDGASVEEIVSLYPSLNLPEVYAVIAYYLGNQDRVDAYIAEQERLADEIREEVEAQSTQAGLRAKLLSRRTIKN